MKTRVIKSKKIEPKRKPLKELVNNLFFNKGQSQWSLKTFLPSEAFGKASSKSGNGLGVAHVTGSAVQQFSAKNSQEKSNDFSKITSKNESMNPAQFREESPYSALELTTSQLQPSSTIKRKENLVVENSYLSITKLDKTNYGRLSDRYNAIYNKIYYNKRMIQTSDLRCIDEITRGQNTYFMTMMCSLGLFPYSLMSSVFNRSIQTRLLLLGFAGIFTSIGFLTHYNGRLSDFLVHTDSKYFYGTTIDQLEDKSLTITNKPRALKFEKPCWSLKKRLSSIKSRFMH